MKDSQHWIKSLIVNNAVIISIVSVETNNRKTKEEEKKPQALEGLKSDLESILALTWMFYMKNRNRTTDEFVLSCGMHATMVQETWFKKRRRTPTLVNTSSITNDSKLHKIFIKCSVLKVRCQFLLSSHFIPFTFVFAECKDCVDWAVESICSCISSWW